MTSESKIDYEALSQDAMRGLVRTVLQNTAKNGLPGDHHFYISFDTNAAGVSISKRLREKYPNEMTIVLQHRFWDLAVHDERFEVKLTFDGIPERVVVPFKAIKVFFDPFVRFGLQFEEPDFNAEAVEMTVSSLEQNFAEPDNPAPTPAKAPEPPANTPAVSKLQRSGTDGEVAGQGERSSSADEGDADSAEGERQPAGAEIVSLDAFRKK